MDTEKFIALVKKYPVLYDKRHKDFKNAVKKGDIWEVISREMNESSEVLRTKWKGLKDGYTKYRKQFKGNGPTDSKYIKWCWGSHLVFLENYISHKKLRSQTSIGSQDNSYAYLPLSGRSAPSSPSRSVTATNLPVESMYDSESSEDNDPLEKISTKLRPQTQTSNQISITEPISLSIDTKTNEDVGNIYFMRNKRVQYPDAVDHLFMSYAETFKKFSIRRQTRLKVEMAKLFADAELEEHGVKEELQFD